jgi:hypothetical protein
MGWESSGVPGSQTRTSWYDRDLPAMWRVLENQQSDDHWRLVAGWRKAAELTATHLRRLEHYRANLADVWPPDRNAAAAAYVARLDFLIQNVRTTHDVAAANYSTLAATVGALAAARRDLKPLHDEYVAKSRAIKEYADLAALNAAAEAPTVIGAAPARAQDLERLNSRARAIMYTLSHTLIEAEAAIRQPPTYQPWTGRDSGNPDVTGTRRTGGRTTGAPASLGAPPHDGPDAEAKLAPESRMLRNPDAHMSRTADLSPSTSGRGPLRRAAAELEGELPVAESRAIGQTGQGMRVPTSAADKPPRGALLPPGGVIGPTPHPHRPNAQVVRVNPVGGLIEGVRPSVTSNGVGLGPPVFGALGRPSAEPASRRIESGNPETIWEVPQGSPPIITPSQTSPNFDPGPTIGIDR